MKSAGRLKILLIMFIKSILEKEGDKISINNKIKLKKYEAIIILMDLNNILNRF